MDNRNTTVLDLVAKCRCASKQALGVLLSYWLRREGVLPDVMILTDRMNTVEAGSGQRMSLPSVQPSNWNTPEHVDLLLVNVA